MPGPEGVLVDRSTVYQYDQDARLVLPRARLPAGETLAGYGMAGDAVTLLSNRALYFYDARELENDDGVLQPRQRVPLPGAVGDLQRIDAMELLDGWLLSFAFVRSSYNAEGALPFQQIVRVDEAGHVRTVARREVRRDYPDAWRYQNWFPSPVVYTVQETLKTAFADGMAPLRKEAAPIPRAIAILAGVLMLLSAIAAWWRVRQTALPPLARIAWIVASAILGLPAVMALWLMYPLRETVDDLAVDALPATA
jgi:hypothetical protein